MLEKKPGITLTEKLQDLLLMEDDSNASYKEIFCNRMLNMVRSHVFMPEEIYSDNGKTADDCSLLKVILYDIVRQARISAALSSFYAANCYNIILHAIASLFFQAFGVPFEAVESMLTVIEEIQYFLLTAYGHSKNFAGSTIELKFQGFFQGIGAAPAGWAFISITIICAHKRTVHGGHFVCHISNLTGHLVALLFVDDTDLVHINLKAGVRKKLWLLWSWLPKCWSGLIF